MKPEKDDFRVVEYPFHLGDLVGGTTNLNDEQFGAYMRILLANISAQAKKGGLPANQEVLRSYTRMGPAAWKKLWLLIGEKFTEENGVIFNERVKATVNRIINNSNVARNNRLGINNSEETPVNPSSNNRPTNPKTLKPSNQDNNSNSESSNNPPPRKAAESGSGFSNENSGGGLRPLGGFMPTASAFKIEHLLTDSQRQEAKGHAPGWDFGYLCREYDEWIAKKGPPDKPAAAFMGWLKKKTGGKRPPV